MYGRYQRSMGKLRATIGSNFNLSKFNQFIQSDTNPNLSETFSQGYNVSSRTLFRNAPNFETGLKYSISETNIGSLKTKYFTETPFIEIDALVLKSLLLEPIFPILNLVMKMI